MELQLISDLFESKLFPSRQNLRLFTVKDIANMCFLNFLALLVMKNNPETQKFAVDYLYQTFKYNNFDRLDTTTTDLGWLLHVLVKKDISLLKEHSENVHDMKKIHISEIAIKMWSKRVILAKTTDTEDRRFTLLLREMLEINIADYENVRLLACEWDDLSHHQRSLVVTRLLFAFRRRMSRSELIHNLELLGRKKELFLHHAEDPEKHHDLNEHKMITSFTNISIKENASAGSTAAGAVASVVQPMMMVKRYKEGSRKKKSKYKVTESMINEIFGSKKVDYEKEGRKALLASTNKLLDSWNQFKGFTGSSATKSVVEEWLKNNWNLHDQETWDRAYEAFAASFPDANKNLQSDKPLSNLDLANFFATILKVRTLLIRKQQAKGQTSNQQATPEPPKDTKSKAEAEAAAWDPNKGNAASANPNWTGARYKPKHDISDYTLNDLADDIIAGKGRGDTEEAKRIQQLYLNNKIRVETLLKKRKEAEDKRNNPSSSQASSSGEKRSSGAYTYDRTKPRAKKVKYPLKRDPVTKKILPKNQQEYE